MTLKRLVSLPVLAVWHALFWTFERATWQYDLMVLAILAFVWLTPPGWLGDPMGGRAGAGGPPRRALPLTRDLRSRRESPTPGPGTRPSRC